jgi:hypothetical protein
MADAKDEKTPLEKLGIRIPDELDGLLGDPPLLEGEDPNLYWGLLCGDDHGPQAAKFSRLGLRPDMSKNFGRSSA